ncbi:uncharacterized protein N7496_000179 [Penicillium cataractarum]|uniref:FAD-binding domain-containing protein n=1 Tax=Penicillium cataractarum TaxID=2100454 RepID=A0A9W9VTH7_9EURO|nr:uncharacterized protein N7496_000179 [Penicillium cataractarum]KAJ5389111.1 hypothetical protein N7496_000179 [Penicillium cataractarum]
MGSCPRDHVTVGIVGGGIAGLGLSRMLELSGISYCLWEAHSQFAPPTGVSIGLMPNGLRILDQLGMIEKFDEYDVERKAWEHRDGHGNLQANFNPSAIREEKLGYGGIFMERRRLLQILHGSIENKTRLYTSKRVVSVRQTEQEAIIVSEDGSEVSCDFIAGADGIRSIIRREIERTTFTIKSPESRFDARYACTYGISNPVLGIEPGRSFTVYRPNVSLLIFCGHSGDVYWFMMRDLKRTIVYDKPERFLEKDIEALYAQVAETIVTDGVVFANIFRNKRTAIMTALEEGIAERFFFGRLFLLGDSAHKMVPHAAMGANQALESAAAFVNILRSSRLQKGDCQSTRIPLSEVQSCLEQYELRRRARATAASQIATFACRAQLKIGPASDEYWANFPRMMGEEGIAKSLESFCDAEMLENWSMGSPRVAVYTAFVKANKRPSWG